MKICDAVWTKLTWILSPLFYFSGAEVHLLPYLRDPFYSVFTQSSRMLKQNFLILCLLCSPSPRPAPRPMFSFFLSLLASFSSFLLFLEHCQAKTVAQPRMCIYNTAVTCFPDNAERTGFFFFLT